MGRTRRSSLASLDALSHGDWVAVVGHAAVMSTVHRRSSRLLEKLEGHESIMEGAKNSRCVVAMCVVSQVCQVRHMYQALGLSSSHGRNGGPTVSSEHWSQQPDHRRRLPLMRSK